MYKIAAVMTNAQVRVRLLGLRRCKCAPQRGQSACRPSFPAPSRTNPQAWQSTNASRPAPAPLDPPTDGPILDQALQAHARRARRGLSRMALAIDRAIRRHGRSLAERQLEIGALSARVRDLVSVIAVAHHADADSGDHALAAADVWCRLTLARASGRHLTAADHTAVAALGKAVAGCLP